MRPYWSSDRTLGAILTASIRHVRFGSKADIGEGATAVCFTPKSEHHLSPVPRVDILASSLRLSSSLYWRASAMGFNRRKMEDQRRETAEKEAATRRATDAQVV